MIDDSMDLRGIMTMAEKKVGSVTVCHLACVLLGIDGPSKS